MDMAVADKSEKAKALQAARERHPELTLELRAALGEMPEVIEAMAACVLRGG